MILFAISETFIVDDLKSLKCLNEGSEGGGGLALRICRRLGCGKTKYKYLSYES